MIELLFKHPEIMSPRTSLWSPRPGDGCVLWLPGQDDPYSATIRDRSGYNNHGTITGATWNRRFSGLWGLTYNLDDRIDCGTNASLMTATPTYSFWFKRSTTGGRDEFGGNIHDAPNTGWELWNSGENIQLSIYDDGGNIRAVALGAIADTNLHFISFALNGATCVSVFDGVVTTQAFAFTMGTPTANLRIGDHPADGFLGLWGFRGDMYLHHLENIPKTGTQQLERYQSERHLFGV